MRLFARVALPLLALAFLPAESFAESCYPSPTRLCLAGYRFAVEVAWVIPGGGSGDGQGVPLSEDTGLFWYFGNSNLELVVKVLDGRAVNRHFWVYYGSLSDVEHTITITDLETGVREIYHNPAGHLSSQADTTAFEPEPPADPSGPPAPASPSTPLLRMGPEFQVNVNTAFLQLDPSIAAGSDSGFMVVWSDDGLGQVMGRVFDAAGRPRSGEIGLSAGPTSGGQFDPKVVAVSAGEYAAVWREGARIFGQRFGLDGQKRGGTFAVGGGLHPQSSPLIVADSARGFLVAWAETGDGGSGITKVQRFGAAGRPEAPEVVLGPARSYLQMAASPTGGFLATWIEGAGDLFETDVWAERLSDAGAPLGAFPVSAAPVHRPGYNFSPLPVARADGSFSIVWQTYVFCCSRPGTPGLFARRFTADGEPEGTLATLRGGPPTLTGPAAAAVLPSGDVLLLWLDWGAEDIDGGVFGQLYDASWSLRGSRFRLNTYTDRDQTDPAVAVDAAGNVVAVWSSGEGRPVILPTGLEGQGTQDGSFYGVFSQRLTTASCALNPDQLCLAGRFRVDVRFKDPRTGTAETAHAVPLTSDSGAFWFFAGGNVELMVKVIDGRPVNGFFWFYSGALSDVEYTITVMDTATGKRKTYRNPRGTIASLADSRAFPAD